MSLSAQSPRTPDWASLDAETLTHFQAIVRMDSSDPPGNELPVVNYLAQVLEREGVPFDTFAVAPNRPNLVARLKGNGSKRPILIMGHTDTVNVDPARWKPHGPFSAARDGGHIYGRGTLDNKSSVVAGLMIMVALKRMNVPLDRDVIFLAEAGEEGNVRFGIDFMVREHWDAIDAEYCLAEGGGVTRQNGQVRWANVQTTEKQPRAIELIASGVSGHASRPLDTNAIVHLGTALGKLGAYQPPISLNETTGTYFRRLAQISSGEIAQRYRDVLDPAKAPAVDRFFRSNEVAHSAMLHFTLSPTVIEGGTRVNVIPAEAKATVDTRILPDDDPEAVLEAVRKVVDDPAISVQYAKRDLRPVGVSRLNTEGYTTIEANVMKHYNVPTLPTMGTGGTDMAYVRGKGVQCYGIGVATDTEDPPLGYGAHSDLERVLESELHRFVHFQWDVVSDLARSR
jgi:acetylornithine deacetylase/succinyl-diaminopimelate desuccinylase-like protein